MLGIGLTTTVFSIVYGVLLKGLPFPDGDRIMTIARQNKAQDINNGGIPITDVERYRTEQQSFAELALVTSGTMNVSGTEKSERFDGSWVSVNLFHMLSVTPTVGPGFEPGDVATRRRGDGWRSSATSCG